MNVEHTYQLCEPPPPFFEVCVPLVIYGKEGNEISHSVIREQTRQVQKIPYTQPVQSDAYATMTTTEGS